MCKIKAIFIKLFSNQKNALRALPSAATQGKINKQTNTNKKNIAKGKKGGATLYN
jgi:hypothetical protein